MSGGEALGQLPNLSVGGLRHGFRNDRGNSTTVPGEMSDPTGFGGRHDFREFVPCLADR